MATFDRYVAVDFSAANRPVLGANSVWVATSDGVVANLSTRVLLEAWLVEVLAVGDRVLVATDIGFGYPAGFAAAVGAGSWHGVWALLSSLVVDAADNASNRFEVAAALNGMVGAPAFWGCPAGVADVPPRRPPLPLPEWRAAEVALRAAGRQPHSAWKLAYAGSVGSQMLLGIPLLGRLRRSFAAETAVWPFEGWAGARVVHAEVWPSMLPFAAEDGSCADERQVNAVVHWLANLDADDRLGPLLDAVPDTPAVRGEEGWVLGAVAPGGW